MPAPTQCIPFQHQLSEAAGSQDRSPQCPVPAGHGHPRCSSPPPQGEGAVPLGFSWVVGAEVWVAAQCVCTAWRGGMFTKGWLQSCLGKEVSVPRSTPAPENRLLVQVGIWVGASSFDWRLPDPLLGILMRRHWLIAGSSCYPKLGGCHAMRACGLRKGGTLPPRFKQRAQGISLFRVLLPVTSSHLAFIPGAASELKLRSYENIHGRETWREGIGRSSGTQTHVSLVSSCLALLGSPTPNQISSCFLCFALIGNAGSALGRKHLNALGCHHSAPSRWHFSGGKQEQTLGVFLHMFPRCSSPVSSSATQEDPVFTVKLGFIHERLLQSLFWVFSNRLA